MLLSIPSFNAEEAIEAAYAEENKVQLDKEALKNAANFRLSDISIALLGAPNPQLSTSTILKFGNHGSISVDLKKCVYYNHEEGEGGDVFSLAMHTCGHTFSSAVEFFKSFLGGDFTNSTFDRRSREHQLVPAFNHKDAEREREKRISKARSIYELGDCPPHGVVYAYLKGRNCDQTQQECLRSKTIGRRYQCKWQMLAKITDIETGCLTGVHVTTLKVCQDRKISVSNHRGRIVYGAQKGSVIRLKGERVAGHVAIAEGIETALSIDGLFDCVLSAINAGNLSKLEMPDGVTQVSVFADNDKAGLKAAYKMQAKCSDLGIQCQIFIPPDDFNDFNDYRRSLI